MPGILGRRAVARGIGRLAQPGHACPSRGGARFSLGNFVLGVHFQDGRWGAGIGPMVSVRSLRIVHGE